MRKFLLFILLALFLFPGKINAQRDSSRNDFTNAESWFLFEEYGEAEFIYQKLLNWYPENDNLKYKIGICLLNDPYRKHESIDYLLQASSNINPAHKDGSFKETTAPPDVLYYLGNAYLVNNMLDPAIESFRKFLSIMDPEVYDEELVRAQIKACQNAKRLMSMPVDLDLHTLDETINTSYPETNPVISGNGERMAFVTEQPFFDEALFIEKEDGKWTLPMSLTSMLGFDMDIYPVALNYEGTEMLLYYDDERIGNLYISRYEDGFWLPAVKLGENISTKYWESHASFSRDGQTLYFTSNRKGSFGGLDIYKSERTADGRWGSPENLGPTINSRYNEETPFITEDGNTLYFSSYGHYNMGGYDIFYSTRNDDGTWGEPVNMGYPINSTDDDIFFHPVNNGFGAYQSRLPESGTKGHDIYYMDIYSVNNPRIYLVSGFVRTEVGDTDLTTLEMLVIDPESGDTLKYNIPIEADGSFTLNLTQGDYKLHLIGEGFQELITPLSITTKSDKAGITIDDVIQLELIKKEVLIFEGEKSDIELKETEYTGTVGVPLTIPLKVKKGSTLIMKHYQDSTLLSTDTIEVDKRRFDLEILPLPGINRLELEMTDSDGNIHKNSLTVTGTEPVKSRKEAKDKEAAATITPEPVETTTPEPVISAQTALLFKQLQQEKESPLHETVMALDLQKEGIDSPQKLFEHLYARAEKNGYSKGDVDLALAEALSGGKPELLRQQLLENSDGPLKAFLEAIDLEKEGIRTSEDLIRHLEEAVQANGYSMDDVREAMIRAIDNPLEVEQLFNKLLKQSDGTMREILEKINLQREKIYTVEDLIETIHNALSRQGFSNREIAGMLQGMFPGHKHQIEELCGKSDKGGFPTVLIVGLSSILLLFILFIIRKRKREEVN